MLKKIALITLVGLSAGSLLAMESDVQNVIDRISSGYKGEVTGGEGGAGNQVFTAPDFQVGNKKGLSAERTTSGNYRVSVGYATWDVDQIAAEKIFEGLRSIWFSRYGRRIGGWLERSFVEQPEIIMPKIEGRCIQ